MAAEYKRTISSPVGGLNIYSDGEYIIKIEFSGDTSYDGENDNTPVLCEAEKQINEYFTGTRTSFTVLVKAEGTDFQKAVWKAMSEIPYGDTATYGKLASIIGKPAASRAVGNACGANPIPIIIPCHRVVSSSGEGGFSGGINIKRFLLELEKRTL
jgi:methylated-DNA-[protein]-cysteine S-methyltransferase